MTYFLDFDRTLFDSDAYNVYLANHPACVAFRDEFMAILKAGRDETLIGGAGRTEIWDRVSALITSGELVYAPGELSQFVFPDVTEFLRMLGNEAIIITYGEKTRQKAKIESALTGIVRLTVLYTGDMTKGDYLAKYPHLVPAQAIFVDDLAAHLEAVETAFPHVKLFEMRRDGGKGAGRWPVVHSLSDLP